MYRTVIVDDERLARLELSRLLKIHPEIELVGEASGVKEAVEMIRIHQPDLLFLDIQLRNESGFDVLERSGFTGRVIFVTAWDQYAVRAFEVNAMDYLMKPVEPDRLSASLGRLTTDNREDTGKQPGMLEPQDVVFIYFGLHPRFQRIDEILMLRAQGPYSELVTLDGRTGLVNKSLKDWEDRLPVSLFMRIHRNCIINLLQVSEVVPLSNLSYRITLKAAADPVIVSRRYARIMKDRF